MHKSYLIQLLVPKLLENTQSTPHKAIDFTQKVERQFLLVDSIQQTEFHTVISIDESAGNDPKKQQRLANITYWK